ncbi:hypothetical protein POKO110462_04380 [Pontibacter korlensis]
MSATFADTRGAQILRAEIIPIEPDPGNAGEGSGTGNTFK